MPANFKTCLFPVKKKSLSKVLNAFGILDLNCQNAVLKIAYICIPTSRVGVCPFKHILINAEYYIFNKFCSIKRDFLIITLFGNFWLLVRLRIYFFMDLLTTYYQGKRSVQRVQREHLVNQGRVWWVGITFLAMSILAQNIWWGSLQREVRLHPND